jgi:hypothetical protein
MFLSIWKFKAARIDFTMIIIIIIPGTSHIKRKVLQSET